MREIKFRGLTKAGEMVIGLPFYGDKIVTERTDNKSPYVEKGSTNYYYEYYKVDPRTIGQYTGLKDKNGKEIYEGDIVQGMYYHYYIEFSDYSFAAFHTKLKKFDNKPLRWGPIHRFYKHGIEIQVIGNIYENKELLP